RRVGPAPGLRIGKGLEPALDEPLLERADEVGELRLVRLDADADASDLHRARPPTREPGRTGASRAAGEPTAPGVANRLALRHARGRVARALRTGGAGRRSRSARAAARPHAPAHARRGRGPGGARRTAGPPADARGLGRAAVADPLGPAGLGQ